MVDLEFCVELPAEMVCNLPSQRLRGKHGNALRPRINHATQRVLLADVGVLFSQQWPLQEKSWQSPSPICTNPFQRNSRVQGMHTQGACVCHAPCVVWPFLDSCRPGKQTWKAAKLKQTYGCDCVPCLSEGSMFECSKRGRSCPSPVSRATDGGRAFSMKVGPLRAARRLAPRKTARSRPGSFPASCFSKDSDSSRLAEEDKLGPKSIETQT